MGLQTALTLSKQLRTEQLQQLQLGAVTVLREREIISPPDSFGLVDKCAGSVTAFLVIRQLSNSHHRGLNCGVGKDCGVRVVGQRGYCDGQGWGETETTQTGMVVTGIWRPCTSHDACSEAAVVHAKQFLPPVQELFRDLLHEMSIRRTTHSLPGAKRKFPFLWGAF